MLLRRVRRQPTWKAVQNLPGERQAKATAPSREDRWNIPAMLQRNSAGR